MPQSRTAWDGPRGARRGVGRLAPGRAHPRERRPTCFRDTRRSRGPEVVARARCVMAHTAHACWLSRATADYLGPGGACHSEPIQSRQPVPLASIALLLRRARFDDAVGRLGLRRIGPRLHHTACCCSQLGRALQKQKNRQKRENEVAWLWRKKMTPALALAPKYIYLLRPVPERFVPVV